VDTDTISPELALVDAETRRRAIAAMPLPRWDVPRAATVRRAATSTRSVPKVVAAVVYFAVGLGHALIWGLAVIGVLAVVAGIGFVR
jgi:hypothetical protein